jgi:hypothetical protein
MEFGSLIATRSPGDSEVAESACHPRSAFPQLLVADPLAAYGNRRLGLRIGLHARPEHRYQRFGQVGVPADAACVCLHARVVERVSTSWWCSNRHGSVRRVQPPMPGKPTAAFLSR